MHEEIKMIIARDPAARSAIEVILCYPSFHAVSVHFLTHWLWNKNFKLLARFLAYIARWISDIEIHPAATIGKNFFIDHGLGVVIGETANIGNNVTLYQGVTLGGVSPSVESDKQRNTKRHPTLCDNVIIGSGAQILGPITIGKCARVGANAVVVRDVAPSTTVVGIPAQAVEMKHPNDNTFKPYGTPIEDLPDPIRNQLTAMSQELADLQHRLQTIHTNAEAIASDPYFERANNIEKQKQQLDPSHNNQHC